MDKPGAVQAIKRNLEQKFSVSGGTLTGSVHATSVTVRNSLTVQSGGVDIILSTNSTTDSMKINGSDGVISFAAEMHNSSWTTLATYHTSQTSHLECVTGSTLTITTTGGSVAVVFSGSLQNDTAGLGSFVSFKQDNAYVSPLTSAFGVLGSVSASGAQYHNGSFFYVIKDVPAGSHDYCLTLAAVGGGTAGIDWIAGAYVKPRFGVMEIK